MTASELFAQRNSREVTGMAKKLSKGRGVGGDRLEICPPRTSSIRLRNSLEVELRIGRPDSRQRGDAPSPAIFVGFLYRPGRRRGGRAARNAPCRPQAATGMLLTCL